MRFLFFILFGLCFSGIQAEERVWTDRQGRSITAELVKADPEKRLMQIRRDDGRTFTLSWDLLSEGDRAYVEDWVREDAASAVGAAAKESPAVSLRATVVPTALHDASSGPATVSGHVNVETNPQRIRVRVTTGLGARSMLEVPVIDGHFSCLYPDDFPVESALRPGVLFIDATADDEFDPSRPGGFQAEATLIVYDSGTAQVPALPSPFTNDLRDERGRVDEEAFEWPVMRNLVNQFMHSRAAHLIGLGKMNFDLAHPDDLTFFKQNLTLYEFDYRDRDWSAPLNYRVRRTFWQAVWDTWFNPSNNNPIDGDDNNLAQDNFHPYTFANDFADTLITYLMMPDGVRSIDDNLETIRREGVENLLAMQHRERRNFARKDALGQEHVYTRGAFRYGMFENGEYLVEGTGWFYNPEHSDYRDGGVFNGRATWALGEALKQDPDGPLAKKLREAIGLSVGFCLVDAQEHGYAKRTPKGNIYWRDAGEHAYLVIGMLAACEVAPGLRVPNPNGGGSISLRNASADALDALVDLVSPDAQWSVYPNVDSVAIAALADGAAVLANHPHAGRWLSTARRVADAWMNAAVDPEEFPGEVIHFGLRIEPNQMTFNWRQLAPDWPSGTRIFFYISGHWIHGLARLYSVTGDERYRERCEAMISYLCGANPWNVRLYNELGAVYNWVDDLSGDGREDTLKRDFYPESTSFCVIGIMHLLNNLAGRER